MHISQQNSSNQWVVHIDRELQEIVPVFLANRQKDLQTIRQALAEQDYSTIRMLGHRMKGDGGGYGFNRITDIGGMLELAASRRDQPAVEQHTAELEQFLSRVTIVYR